MVLLEKEEKEKEETEMGEETVVDFGEAWAPLLGDLSITSIPTTEKKADVVIMAKRTRNQIFITFPNTYPEQLKGYVSEENHQQIMSKIADLWNFWRDFWKRIFFLFCFDFTLGGIIVFMSFLIANTERHAKVKEEVEKYTLEVLGKRLVFKFLFFWLFVFWFVCYVCLFFFLFVCFCFQAN